MQVVSPSDLKLNVLLTMLARNVGPFELVRSSWSVSSWLDEHRTSGFPIRTVCHGTVRYQFQVVRYCSSLVVRVGAA